MAGGIKLGFPKMSQQMILDGRGTGFIFVSYHMSLKPFSDRRFGQFYSVFNGSCLFKYWTGTWPFVCFQTARNVLEDADESSGWGG